MTYVLLTKGKTAAMRDFFSFMAFGMGGTVFSGVMQFTKTLAMRSCRRAVAEDRLGSAGLEPPTPSGRAQHPWVAVAGPKPPLNPA